MGRRQRHRLAMTRHLVNALKEKGKLGEILESDSPTRGGRAIQSLISEVTNEMAAENRKAKSSTVRAWKATVIDTSVIVSASTRGKATNKVLKTVRKAGYNTLKFMDVHTVRCPKHDKWAEVDESGRCWSEEDLPDG